MSGIKESKQFSRSLSHLLKRAVQFSVHLYMDDAGKYFREAERIAKWGEALKSIVGVTVAVLVVVMAFAACRLMP